MGRIIVLDENTSNKIAAGEVVEKPASVVKELVENSIDAGATSISVDIRNGGISYIKVTDNGGGMDEDDVEIAFERHATSKIKRAEDLDSIVTMGFRGEALASIAAISSVELQTKTASSTYGMYVHIAGGVLQDVRQTGCPDGTTFIIKDLFFNTPARYKFLKKDSTEAGYISDTITRIALGNPDIAFKLTSGKTLLLHTPGNNDLKSTIYSVYGKEILRDLLLVNYQDEKVRISGYVGKPDSARSNRNYQSLYINKRYVKSKLVSYTVEQAFSSILMKNKFPFFVLNIEINPLLVDPNVHPAKIDVRFADESHLSRAVYMAVSNALGTGNLFNPVSLPTKDRELFKLNIAPSEREYQQEKLGYVEAPFNLREKSPAAEIKMLNDALKPLARTDIYTMEKAMIPEPTPVSVKNIVEEKPAAYPGLTEMLYIGQAFSTYIILQSGEELVLVDQHAAHERILYEKLRHKYDTQENTTQLLLEPVVIQLQPIELNMVKSKEELLTRIGFVFEDFGNNSIIIRGVPYLAEDCSPKELFLELTEKLQESVRPINTPLADEIIHTIACKAAIKANRKLDNAEVRQLLAELSETGRRYTCPHGRPTVIRLTKYEFEKLFKRII